MSQGFDPAPPGKYEINRIIVDSDLDGVLSGAILRIVYPEAEIMLTDAASIQSGKLNHLIDSKTVTADLKYVEGCGLYFDHHESNRPPTDKFPGRWTNAMSATNVVYDYFKDVVDLSKFDAIIPEINKFDMGDLTLEEFLEPTDVIKLGMVINRNEHEFNCLLIELIANQHWDNVIKHHLVKERLVKFDDSKQDVLRFVRENGELIEGLAFIDARGYASEDKINSYFLVSQFPSADASIIIKYGEVKDELKVRLYRNNFNKNSRDIDLLAIAKKLNPEISGGHRGACGFVAVPGQSVEVIKANILNELKKQL